MKLGILTQPLQDNYGGLLQAYALKRTLESLGHNVTIVNRRRYKEDTVFELKQILKRLLGIKTKYWPSKKHRELISQHTKYFTTEYIKDITEPIYDTEGLLKKANDYDGFVVGSDQVWRPRYSPKISDFFLDFLEDPEKINIAYAASFGVDTWEYTAEEAKICRANINKFRAISVREQSGVMLCEQHLNTKAIHVLDPTMLLEKSDYIKLIEREHEISVGGELLHYVLDKNLHKEELIDKVARHFDFNSFTVTRKSTPNKSTIKRIDNCVYPSVTSWLNGFHRARFVITDSFHGTVFSLLFNKPFLVLVNTNRGRARFESLLKVFDLQDRIVDKPADFSLEDLSGLPEIQWERVNHVVQERKKLSMNFLTSNLNSL